MKITLKDGSSKEYSEAKSVYEIAKDISEGLARAACAGEVDGEIVDLRTVLDKDCTLNIITASDEEGLRVIRHTASHVLAQAVKNLFPDAKITIGPAIDDGFYYDFDSQPFSREDLDALEAELKKIIKQGHEITRFTLPREEAIKFMKEKDEPYKVELIEELPEGEEISFYDQGGFVDLCAGPHLMSTKGVKAFKLTASSMAYWRGDSNKARLHRIYGTAYNKKEDLKAHLERMEEAKKRDHNKLGREMELFTTVDVIGQGLPLMMPKGTKMIMKLQRWIEDLEDKEWGYVRTKTPLMAKSDLYKISGHWDHYKENMYFTQIDEEDYAVKPMNCPGGILYYKTNQHSYRELPKRVGEFGIVHRHELHGALHGLFRVRVFTQDDAHIFMTQDQMKDEVIKTMEMYRKLYSVFGLEYHVELSTRPENSMGSEELWEISTNALRDAVEAAGVPYVINEGDGAFYGPKLDFHIKDCLGRTWQCGTIQMDMQLPERFDVNYVGEDGEKHRAVMLHRAGYGSLERFIGILIEHFAGAFPSWIAPVQVKVVPVTEKHMNYAKSVADALSASNVRVEIEEGNDTLGYKIRKAQMEKVPYTLVVGDKEMNGHTVSIRSRKNGDEGSLPVAVFVSNLIREIRDRSY